MFRLLRLAAGTVIFGSVAIIGLCWFVAPQLPRASETPVPSAVAAIAPAPTKEPPFLDAAAESFERDGVKISVTSVTVGPVELKSFGRNGVSDREFLLVRLTITNTDPARKLDYRGWTDTFLYGATLKDNLGNRYTQQIANNMVRQAEPGAVYVGTPISDLLAFERPVEAATFLFLELPGQGVGLTEPIRFRVRLANATPK